MSLPLPAKRMLTDQEAADYCGFRSVKTFRAKARVPPVDYGNCVRFDRHRLDEWLDQLTQSGAHDEALLEAFGDEGSAGARA